MINEQQIIDKLLSTVEAIIENNREALSSEEIDEYVVAAIWAFKRYGRKCPTVQLIDAVSMYDLDKAGLTRNDYITATYY